MNAAEYRARREAAPTPAHRATCSQCLKAVQTCYCGALRPFTPPVDFVILQHYDEARNAIATARMAHLSLPTSRLIMDNYFAEHAQVNALIAAPDVRNILLYPDKNAMPLDAVLASADPRPPVFWVLDAKWSKVRKMLRLSPNVRALPTARFEPDRASTFQIRRQPDPCCLSTIESIYLVIDRYRRLRGDANRDHDALLDVFHHLVRQQLGFVRAEDTRHLAAKLKKRAAREARLTATSTSTYT